MGFVSRVVIVVFGLFMGAFSIALFELGLNLGWVYLFMGVVIGSAVIPLWNMMTWSKASGTGAVIAAWGGFVLAIIGWMVGASIQGGSVSIDTLGTNEVMLSGNLIAICSSGIIHFVYSMIFPQNFDFSTLNDKIELVENDLSGLSAEDQDPVELDKAYKWITIRGWVLTIVLVIIWPLLSIPAGVFTESYFAFRVLLSIAWGFGAAIVVTFLPIMESFDELTSITANMMGKGSPKEVDEFEDEA